MIVNARDWNAGGYKKGSTFGAIRAVLDKLEPMGQPLIVDKLIDMTSATVPPEWIVTMAQKVTKPNETFSFHINDSRIMIRRLEDVEHEAPPILLSKKWPFNSMQIGDIVEIRVGEYGKANPQVYAHVYGRQSGMKFKTKRKESRFIIERIA